MAEKNAMIRDAVFVQHRVAHMAVHLPDGTAEAEVARLQGGKIPFQKSYFVCRNGYTQGGISGNIDRCRSLMRYEIRPGLLPLRG
jgi:hypothetical protein